MNEKKEKILREINKNNTDNSVLNPNTDIESPNTLSDKKNTKHLFEIPWNGDIDLVDQLFDSPKKDKVKFIYMPCAIEDGNNTRATELKTHNRKELEETVNYIFEKNFKPCILLQRDVKKESLQYYYELGVRNFTVGEDKIAHCLREKYGDDIYITASITKDLLNEDYEWYSIHKPDLYNIFILRFGYSRDIENLSQLPQNLKYGIMPGIICLWYCQDYRKHWFPKKNESYVNKTEILDCEKFRCNADGSLKFNDTMLISSNDLWLFDPYVESYKITDRMEKTPIIMNRFEIYSNADITQKTGDEKINTWNKYNLAHGKQIRAGAPIY